MYKYKFRTYMYNLISLEYWKIVIKIEEKAVERISLGNWFFFYRVFLLQLVLILFKGVSCENLALHILFYGNSKQALKTVLIQAPRNIEICKKLVRS